MKKKGYKPFIIQALMAAIFFSLILPGHIRAKKQEPQKEVKVIPLNELADPLWLLMDNKRLYISDKGTIKIFSMDDFGLLKTVGSPGEGPGEFKDTPFPSVDAAGLWVHSGNKMSLYSHTGRMIKEITGISSGLHAGKWLKPVKKGEHFLGYKLKYIDKLFYLTYVLLDRDFKEIKELHRREWALQRNKKRQLFENIFYDVLGDKIVFAHYSPEFAIDILDAEGKLLHSIRRSDKRIPFTDKDKQNLFNYWSSHPLYRKNLQSQKKRYRYPENYPAISACRTAGKKIYALTYLKRGGENECLVYNMRGKFLKRIFIPLLEEVPRTISVEPTIFTIYEGQLFQLVDNPEEETWELHIHRIE